MVVALRRHIGTREQHDSISKWRPAARPPGGDHPVEESGDCRHPSWEGPGTDRTERFTMTQHDDTAPRSATEAPPAPGADTGESPNPDLEEPTELPPSDSLDDGPDGDGSTAAAPDATSPTLDHLDETIKQAQHAADEALAPQRE